MAFSFGLLCVSGAVSYFASCALSKCSFDNRALCTNIFIEYILITTYYPEDRLPEADNSMYHTDVM